MAAVDGAVGRAHRVRRVAVPRVVHVAAAGAPRREGVVRRLAERLRRWAICTSFGEWPGLEVKCGGLTLTVRAPRVSMLESMLIEQWNASDEHVAIYKAGRDPLDGVLTFIGVCGEECPPLDVVPIRPRLATFLCRLARRLVLSVLGLPKGERHA